MIEHFQCESRTALISQELRAFDHPVWLAGRCSSKAATIFGASYDTSRRIRSKRAVLDRSGSSSRNMTAGCRGSRRGDRETASARVREIPNCAPSTASRARASLAVSRLTPSTRPQGRDHRHKTRPPARERRRFEGPRTRRVRWFRRAIRRARARESAKDRKSVV